MEKMKMYLSELEHYLKQKNPKILERFQSPMLAHEIDTTFKKIGINDLSLKQLYLWRNGIDYNSGDWTIGEVDIFRFGTMISLKDSLDHYDSLTTEGIFSEFQFPLFTQGDGDFILFDFAGKETDKMLLLYAPTLLLSEQPQTIYDSLEAMFKTIIECYSQGAYAFQENELQIDYALEEKISKLNNPNSSFWKTQ